MKLSDYFIENRNSIISFKLTQSKDYVDNWKKSFAPETSFCYSRGEHIFYHSARIYFYEMVKSWKDDNDEIIRKIYNMLYTKTKNPLKCSSKPETLFNDALSYVIHDFIEVYCD